MAKILNLTPHEINLVLDDGRKIIFPPTDMVARVELQHEIVDHIDGIPVFQTNVGAVKDLPDPEDGTLYIVSSLVLGNCQDHKDLISPNTGGNAIRNSYNQVLAVRGFKR